MGGLVDFGHGGHVEGLFLRKTVSRDSSARGPIAVVRVAFLETSRPRTGAVPSWDGRLVVDTDWGIRTIVADPRPAGLRFRMGLFPDGPPSPSGVKQIKGRRPFPWANGTYPCLETLPPRLQASWPAQKGPLTPGGRLSRKNASVDLPNGHHIGPETSWPFGQLRPLGGCAAHINTIASFPMGRQRGPPSAAGPCFQSRHFFVKRNHIIPSVITTRPRSGVTESPRLRVFQLPYAKLQPWPVAAPQMEMAPFPYVSGVLELPHRWGVAFHWASLPGSET